MSHLPEESPGARGEGRPSPASDAPARDLPEPVAGGRSTPVSGLRAHARWPSRAAWLWIVLGGALWFALCTWRLGSVPGMSLDEAWSILSARGQWPPSDPLSGMTAYSGPFPVLILDLLGTEHGLWVLRLTSVLANGAALGLIGLMLRRAVPRATDVAWALSMLATAPVWLIVMRVGIEISMFMPLALVLGLYLFMRRTPRGDFVAGLVWGLAIYNHVVAGCFVLAIAISARLTYGRGILFAPRRALLGGVLGVLPRLVALVAFWRPPELLTTRYSLLEAAGDLRWLPLCLWQTLHGDTVYLRYVGRLAIEPLPYWLLALVFVAPWIRRREPVPRAARFVLCASLVGAMLMTLAAPQIAVRFLLLPVLGVIVGLALVGGGAIERDQSWHWPVVAAAVLLSACNLFYGVMDFYRPWQSHELGITTFFLGDRSKHTGNWAFFPKEELVRELLALAPPPQQIVTVPTLERALRVLLDGAPVRVVLASTADPALSSVFLDYLWPESPESVCEATPTGELCFDGRSTLAQFYVMYRSR